MRGLWAGLVLLCAPVNGGEYGPRQQLACSDQIEYSLLLSWIQTVCCEFEGEEPAGRGCPGSPTSLPTTCRSGACQRAVARAQTDCAGFLRTGFASREGGFADNFATVATLCDAAAAATPAWAPPTSTITGSGVALPRCGGLLADGLGTHGASGLDRIALPAPPAGQQLQFRVRSLYLEDGNSVTIQDSKADHFFGPALSGHTTADWTTIDTPWQEIDVALNM